MANVLITILQALQLVALGPCLFVICFLALTARNFSSVIVPILYFAGLVCSFMIPLLDLFIIQREELMLGLLLFGESLGPALSFLLIIQFLRGHVPPLAYWLILALPLLGGSSLVYGTVIGEEICLMQRFCLEPDSLKTLYSIFSASLIFLLLIVNFSRSQSVIPSHDPNRAHKYWLILALILMNLQLLAVDLARIADRISVGDAAIIATIIRITFIYLVLTSLFRVFDKVFELDLTRIPTARIRSKPNASEQASLDRIEQSMREEKLYREMGFSRENFATRVGLAEHQLSRLINTHLNMNYNEYINGFRVEEAKTRLMQEDTPVTTIAFEVGFSSIASFNRVFKDQVGCSPSEYRGSKKQG